MKKAFAIGTILTVLLATLKLVGIINVAWVVVALPILIAILLIFIALAMVGVSLIALHLQGQDIQDALNKALND